MPATVTASELRTAGIPGLTGTTEDTRLTALIARVDAQIAAWLGYTPASAGGSASAMTATYTDYLDGPDDDDASILRLGTWPIQSVTSIYDDANRAYGATTLVSSSDYELDAERGLVLALPTGAHASWTSSLRAIKVTYVAGYSTTPGWLYDATILECQHRLRTRAAGPVESVSRKGATMRLSASEGLTEEARGMLWPHRLPRAILSGVGA